jgi:hypothetical protein
MSNYTTQTAALKAVTIDTAKIDAKQIDAKKIFINGEQVEANPERVKSISFGGYFGNTPISSLKDDVSIITHNSLNNDVPEINAIIQNGPPPYSNSFLWGTTTSHFIDKNKDNKTQLAIVDGFVGLPPKNHVQDNPSITDGGIFVTLMTGDGYHIPGASLPNGTKKVIHNFVYDTNGRITTLIRPERMYSNFFASLDTLEEWVADMPNLNKCYSNFNWGDGNGGVFGYGVWGYFMGSGLRKFVGDLSSLRWGGSMF